MEAKATKNIDRELRTLARFIQLYCDDLHGEAVRSPVQLRTHDVARIAGREVNLCPSCQKLLAHAFTKRAHCPMDPKPMCKHCPNHCYAPAYRQQIREVMKHSGRKLVMSGRIDYLLHLFF